MSSKGPNAFRTISEAADEVGVAQHVLRFWETKFAFVDPVKRAGGRRFYRPADIDLLKAIRRLLHDEGLTIRGVEKLHKTQGMGGLLGQEPGASSTPAARSGTSSNSRSVQRLAALADTLEAARRRLDAALSPGHGA